MPTNFALASNGATATAASTAYNAVGGFLPSHANNGERTGAVWATDGGWNNQNNSALPEWLQIDFSGSQTIGEIDVFFLQDNYASPITPTLSTTFTLYGVTGFYLQYWNGSSWVTIATVTGNDKVWRQFTFTPVTTTKIRCMVTASPDGYARIVELEAWDAVAAIRRRTQVLVSRKFKQAKNNQITLLSGATKIISVGSTVIPTGGKSQRRYWWLRWFRLR